MTTCLITLDQLGKSADLTCSANLLRVVRRLPRALQHRWAEKAEELLSMDEDPTFQDLLHLVEQAVAVMSTEYGQIVFSPNRPSVGESHRHDRVISTHNTGISTSYSSRCALCDGNHPLASYTKFIEMRLEDRILYIKTTKRCFQCIKPNHVAANCRSTVICGELGCSKSHHSLAHSNEETPTNVCGSTTTNPRPSYVRLGVVPVRSVCPTEHCDTHKFIDDGLDAMLISEDVAKKTGVKGIPSSDVIGTLHGSQSVACAKTDCKIQSLDGLASTTIMKRLPISEVDSLPPGLTGRCKHLRNVSTDELKDNRVQEIIDTMTNNVVKEDSSAMLFIKLPDIPYHSGIEDTNISDLTLRDDVNEPLIDNKSNAVNDIAIAEFTMVSM